VSIVSLAIAPLPCSPRSPFPVRQTVNARLALRLVVFGRKVFFRDRVNCAEGTPCRVIAQFAAA
jgi:hypothetical protein